MAELPLIDDVALAAQRAGLATPPSELHGALCGWLAGGGADDPRWPARVLADDSLPAPEAGGPLDALRLVSVSQLDDHDYAFELLLPMADATLSQRAEAVFDWCRGFLGGFGLAAGAHPPLSEEGGEALQDMARLAQASGDDMEDDEEDEAALSEIEEFVRVAVLLLYGDCVLGPRHRQRLN